MARPSRPAGDPVVPSWYRAPRPRRARLVRPGLVAAAAFLGAAALGYLPFSGGSPDAPRPFIPAGEAAGAGGSGRPGAATAAPGRSPAPERHGPDERIGPPAGPPPVATLSGYVWPLPKGRLTLKFGHSPWGSRLVDGERFHDGIDLATFCGDRIVAAHAGTVLAAGRRFDDHVGWIGDLGPYYERLDRKGLWSTLPIVVVIDDGNGYRSIYAHFSKVVVKKGQRVKAGQLIGYEGRTGRASGCHLHYGIFSPLEQRRFETHPDSVKRMKVPRWEIARIDPLLVLPPRPSPTPRPKPGGSAAPSTSPAP